MNIYVKSGGYQREQDYRWWKNKEPKILEEEIYQLIDGEYFSLVIARYNQKLFLYVTALKSNRVDFKGRKIENSVLWECESNLEEYVRQVAAFALQNKLSEKIESAIKEDKNSPYGFEVDLDKIELEKLMENKNLKVDSNHGLKLEKDKNYLATLEKDKNYLPNYNQDSFQELVKELKAEKLPNREGVLIVVTTSTTEAELKKAEVWRGISDQVVTEKEQPWKEIEIEENPVIKSIKSTGEKLLKKLLGDKGIKAIYPVVFLIFLGIAYMLFIYLLSPSLLVDSNSLSICKPVTLQGRYNPIKTQNIFLEVDGKYKIGNSKKEKGISKIILNHLIGTWNLTYRFNHEGERTVRLKARDTNGKEIRLKKKKINITKDCL
ncbi:MAG: hypothetical protein F6K18_28890 [Okeania sp. SIO2C2]|uniref:hypothetical protein n=1 Tax=Okeania sp. SIO2C2 TaxID=2607787 RepID=UPI0013B5B999|nr:hypothetical protein [Okeania sp. SIO2C2]NEP90514.1 hypothetical protein [Okeania sp. SIO2C2]